MFANCQKGGINMAAPDVCKTPVGPSVVPIPYPNIAVGATANPATAATKVLISGAPAHNLRTTIPMSNGDNPGVAGGIMSGRVMGPCKHIMGVNSVLIGGSPATTMTGMTGQNGSSSNTKGATIAPAQTKVIITKGSGQSKASRSESKAPKEVPTINGRAPINSKYAGQTHPSGVEFNKQGFPDFSPYSKAEVNIKGLTSNYKKDAAMANKAVGLKETPEGYVWHHVENSKTMQLIPRDIHNAVRHTGGSAVIRNGGYD